MTTILFTAALFVLYCVMYCVMLNISMSNLTWRLQEAGKWDAEAEDFSHTEDLIANYASSSSPYYPFTSCPYCTRLSGEWRAGISQDQANPPLILGKNGSVEYIIAFRSCCKVLDALVN